MRLRFQDGTAYVPPVSGHANETKPTQYTAYVPPVSGHANETKPTQYHNTPTP